MVNAFAREQRPVTPEMIAEVAADFRLTMPVTAGRNLRCPWPRPRRTAKACCARLFRLLRTMDNQTYGNRKNHATTTAGRRV